MARNWTFTNGPMPFGYEVGAKGTGTVQRRAAKEAYYLLQDVKKGTYEMVIGNADALGGTLVELASPNAIPQVLGAVASESGARDGTVIPNQFDIDWAYFRRGRGQRDGCQLLRGQGSTGLRRILCGRWFGFRNGYRRAVSHSRPTLSELRPGWYYTYVEVNDGRNLAERIYSDERIFIDMDNAPDSVEQMATLAGVKQLHRCLGLPWPTSGRTTTTSFTQRAPRLIKSRGAKWFTRCPGRLSSAM